MTDSILVLGCDNAMSHTGLVLMDYNRYGGCQEVIYHATVKPRIIRKHPDVADFCARLRLEVGTIESRIRPLGLDLLATEGAFAKAGRASRAGIEVAQAGGIAIGMVLSEWRHCAVVTLEAAPIGKRQGWRAMVLKSNPRDKDACIAECRLLAGNAGMTDCTEHEAEAFGIGSAGAIKYFERKEMSECKPIRQKKSR